MGNVQSGRIPIAARSNRQDTAASPCFFLAPGFLEPQEDKVQSAAQVFRNDVQSQHADAWINWLYSTVAETLADAQELKEPTLQATACGRANLHV